jgi:ribosome-binding protein aMBF1 (putative translation factor)
VELDDYIEEQEQDPQRRALLAEARRRLAGELYIDAPAKALVRMRMARGLSQRQLASIMETSQSHIALLEAGATDPRLGTVERLAKVLDQALPDVVSAWIQARDARERQGTDE